MAATLGAANDGSAGRNQRCSLTRHRREVSCRTREMMIAAIIIGVVQVVLLAQAVRNRKLFALLRHVEQRSAGASISVCLPMRDEEANAERILASITSELDCIAEVIVLDDGSTDRTPEILRAFQVRYPGRVRIVNGKTKPSDWRAKVWAMQQLCEVATGDTLVFIDADVHLAPGALDSVLGAARQEESDFFSIFPRQITTRSTDLLVDHLFTTLLHLLPMQFVSEAAYPSAVAGCGQLQVITRSALSRIGGYASLRESLHDGLHSARLVKRSGDRVGFAYGADLVSCEMYPSFREAWRGFTRNAFQASVNAPALVLTSAIMLGAFVAGPLLLLCGSPAAIIALSPTVVLYLHYVFIARTFDLRPDFVLRLPLSVVLSTAVQWWSFIKDKLGIRTTWRGRAA
ncbi:MAG: glycosyltransferase [Bacteroidetes bacterium]|nr:glycosyltransferase [Bacteroidota bacterium]